MKIKILSEVEAQTLMKLFARAHSLRAEQNLLAERISATEAKIAAIERKHGLVSGGYAIADDDHPQLPVGTIVDPATGRPVTESEPEDHPEATEAAVEPASD